MTSLDAARAAPPDACSVCGAACDALGRCAKCGAVFGEAYRCPLCQALSDVEPDPTLYYRCRSCGGPRIPPTASPNSAAELELLRRARAEQLRAVAFRGGAGFALGSGVLSLLVTSLVLVVTSAPPIARTAALVASLVPFVLCAFALRHARAQSRKLTSTLDRAWLLAAERALGQDGVANDAQSLAQALRVDRERAELLLAEVSVEQSVQGTAGLPARLRVTELADPTDLAVAAEQLRASDALARKP